MKTHQYSPEIEVFGEVVDPADLIQQWEAVKSARIQESVAQSVVDRTTKLHSSGGLASERSLEEANQALELAVAKTRLARISLNMTWGMDIAGMKEEDQQKLIDNLVDDKVKMIRLSMPLSTSRSQIVRSAKISSRSEPNKAISSQSIWPAPKVSIGGMPGYFIIVSGNSHDWPMGYSVTGWLNPDMPLLDGVMVPADSVIFDSEKAWVFQAEGDGQFVQKAISLDDPVEGGWFVRKESLNVELPIVIEGAQSILALKLQNRSQASFLEND
ncbi:hypothetical protein JIN85_12385 [Luteolibacter pohnpeiensis]|uniref:Uncharacterized protein n=1 Tax=Luteolibacter pohnpeiensis TaxID=454153 RepID=A0A934S996_9BACT|nr:hypothetical protein [Luteolibacter pohnpeiensis]MBK1883216.1 hypothetical protein [Luteolibacter pohnpeiensis]